MRRKFLVGLLGSTTALFSLPFRSAVAAGRPFNPQDLDSYADLPVQPKFATGFRFFMAVIKKHLLDLENKKATTTTTITLRFAIDENGNLSPASATFEDLDPPPACPP